MALRTEPGRQDTMERKRCHIVLSVDARKWVDAYARKLGLSRGQMIEALIRKNRGVKIDVVDARS